MNIMIVFESDAALGYKQLVYLIRLDKTKNGYNYLCIDTLNVTNSDIYNIGEIVEDLEDIYIHISDYSHKESPLYGTFLYNFFIENYTFI